MSVETTGRRRTFFGQPFELSTLFGVELWERFSFYGMQGILLIYLYYTAAQGGLGLSQSTATSIVGAYGGAVYLSTILGAWVADRLLGPERVRAGDVVVAMASSGFHSNGYSLVRRVVDRAGLDLAAVPDGLGRPLGDALLEPTRIYALDCLALVGAFGVDGVHAYAHITGGGLAGNTARVVPDGLTAVLDRSTWALPAAVRLMEEHGVPRAESERAFNCGVGMVAAVSADVAEAAVQALVSQVRSARTTWSGSAVASARTAISVGPASASMPTTPRSSRWAAAT